MAERDIVFVTGASGFVGQKIVQELREKNYKVRALAHRSSVEADASTEVVRGELSQPATYSEALRGVSAVVHAALTGDLSQEPDATAALFNAASKSGVKKFIHLSSIAVYGHPPVGTITEQTPPRSIPAHYSAKKLMIEEVLRVSAGIPEIIALRLGCVYGPDGGWWTRGLLSLMKNGSFILVDQGSGTANLIHVTDVARSIPCLLLRTNAPFEVFNLTDGSPVSWRVYFSKLEEILGRKATVSMSVKEAQEYGRKWLRPGLGRRLLRKLRAGRFIHPLADVDIDWYASRSVYSPQRALADLSFRPVYDLETGMQTVRAAFGRSYTS